MKRWYWMVFPLVLTLVVLFGYASRECEPPNACPVSGVEISDWYEWEMTGFVFPVGEDMDSPKFFIRMEHREEAAVVVVALDPGSPATEKEDVAEIYLYKGDYLLLPLAVKDEGEIQVPWVMYITHLDCGKVYVSYDAPSCVYLEPGDELPTWDLEQL